MGLYTLPRWIAFFLFYSFFGWTLETGYVSVKERRFVNRGFLRGPFLPLYGSGALLYLITCKPLEAQPHLVFIAGMASATALEYATGAVMELLYKVKYWDYSHKRFNFRGRICLESSLAWGALALAAVYLIHGPVERVVMRIPANILMGLDVLIVSVGMFDLGYAFRTALNVTAILKKLTELRGEAESLREQLARSDYPGELRQALAARMEGVRAEYGEIMGRMRHYLRAFISAHPSASSKWFSEALNEVKARIWQGRGGRGER